MQRYGISPEKSGKNTENKPRKLPTPFGRIKQEKLLSIYRLQTGMMTVLTRLGRKVVASKISVLLVDDHAVVRTGYKAYLSLSDKIGQIYEADRGETACQMYIQHQPDIVVTGFIHAGHRRF